MDANGWGRYVSEMIGHILARLHYLERDHDDLKFQSRAQDAHSTKEPSQKEIWQERKEAAREIGIALRWLAVGILLALLGFRVISVADISKFSKLLGTGV